MQHEVNGSLADRVINACYDHALIGLPLAPTARQLAEGYLKAFGDPDVAIDRLIRWQVAKCGVSGFLTGLGGLITLPVAIPADIAATWYVNIRMVAAIAHIRGYDLRADATRTAVFLCLVGNDAGELAAKFGAKVNEDAIVAHLEGLDHETLARLDRAIALRMVIKLGEKGITNAFKLAPLLGGAVRGTVNVVSCLGVGNVAKGLLVTHRKSRSKA